MNNNSLAATACRRARKTNYWSIVMKSLLLALPLFILPGCEAEHNAAPEVTYLQMPGTEDLGLPFSSAVRVGHTLYLSGNLGNVPGTLELAAGGIEGETRQTLENTAAVLEQFGSSLDDVVKCTVFLADINDWPAMNAVYRTYFKNAPARSALGANGLALNARVEIECIAVTD
jgi:reactive intermediate/imine deaminase